MTKLSIIFIAALTSACTARAGFGFGSTPVATIPIAPGAPDEPPPPPPAGQPTQPSSMPAAQPAVMGGAYAPGEDQHWFQADDYLVLESTHDARQVFFVAKMTQAAAAGTKNEARFLFTDGQEKWASTYIKSRVASRADLRVGAHVICFTNAWYDAKSDAPKEKHWSRERPWMLGTITDTADMYKGRVVVAGDSCALDSIRVPVQ